MKLFVLLTFVSFGVSLASIPEAWFSEQAISPAQTASVKEPDVNVETTVVNGIQLTTIQVLQGAHVPAFPSENTTQTSTTPAKASGVSDIPNPEDRHVL